MLKNTVQQIANAVKEGGYAIINFPISPRKGAFQGVAPKEDVESLKHALMSKFSDIELIGGNNSAPVFLLKK